MSQKKLIKLAKEVVIPIRRLVPEQSEGETDPEEAEPEADAEPEIETLCIAKSETMMQKSIQEHLKRKNRVRSICYRSLP